MNKEILDTFKGEVKAMIDESIKTNISEIDVFYF